MRIEALSVYWFCEALLESGSLRSDFQYVSCLQARRVFEVICPEEEFLPRAPEPDEIVFNDEGYNTEKSGSSSEAPEEHHGDYEEREDELHDDAATADEVECIIACHFSLFLLSARNPILTKTVAITKLISVLSSTIGHAWRTTV